MRLETTKQKNKRYVAIFNNGKRVNFGQKGAFTYLDGANDATRLAYIARHKVRENWRDPYSPGCLSRYILWEYRDINTAIRMYNEKFAI